MRVLSLLVLSLLLAACGPTVLTETVYEEVYVPVNAPCPDEETYAKVREARPKPLREQGITQPVTPQAEVAVLRPQLGRYEAPGAFADQAMAVIESCHNREIPSGLDPP
jgi:hypothetical protein